MFERLRFCFKSMVKFDQCILKGNYNDKYILRKCLNINITQASAGSGKTFSQPRRCLTLFAVGAKYRGDPSLDQLTNKATRGVKTNIMEINLRRVCSDDRRFK